MYDSDLIEDVVKEILPPTEGFFFGGYEIGEYYKQNIEDTINMIEEERQFYIPQGVTFVRNYSGE